MLLVSADWVLPVTQPPLRDGAVLVDGDRIAAVGSLESLLARHPDVEHEHFAGCMLTPGLVNAHTHLTLTALSGVVPPLPFAEWLPRLVAALKPWEIADHEASGVVGAEECLRSGVTVVGDIAYGAAEVASASAAGLGGVYYWELLGIHADQIGADLGRLRYPERADAFGPRVTCGLSPHSPYTSGPGLLRGVHDKAAELGVPLAIHVAESQAEVELLDSGTGPLAAVASRTAFGFVPPGTGTVRYLEALGALKGATAVHLCHLVDGDAALLAARARGAVTCPRSNRYLSNPPPEVLALLDAGVPLGIGTDSSASNDDLDLMAEVRILREAQPEISAEELLWIATLGGATAIGVDGSFGSIDPGKFADLACFRIDAAGDPHEAVIARAGAGAIEAVMSGGEWRVKNGALLRSDPDAHELAAGAAARSRAALDAAG
jgi:aminodeoxyfutalosine deaminase